MGAQRVMYFSGSSLPLSFLAAALHTGLLAPGKLKEAALLGLSFAKENQMSGGKIYCFGESSDECRVYALWVKGERDMVPRLVTSFLEVYEIKPAEFTLVDTGGRGGWLAAAGLFFWRTRLLKKLGFWLFTRSLAACARPLEELVAGVKGGRRP